MRARLLLVLWIVLGGYLGVFLASADEGGPNGPRPEVYVWAKRCGYSTFVAAYRHPEGAPMEVVTGYEPCGTPYPGAGVPQPDAKPPAVVGR